MTIRRIKCGEYFFLRRKDGMFNAYNAANMTTYIHQQPKWIKMRFILY